MKRLTGQLRRGLLVILAPLRRIATAARLLLDRVFSSAVRRIVAVPPATPSATSSVTPDMTPYERASLRVQRIGVAFQIIGLAAAIASVWFLLAQVKEQVKATNLQVQAIQAQIEATDAQYEALGASVYQDLMSKQLDLNKLFIEKPRIYKYMFAKRHISTDKVPPDVLYAIYYHLDFFQLVYSQRTRLPALQDEHGPDWITWKNTIANTFKESPLLCNVLSESRDMYGADFVAAVFDANDWCKVRPTTVK